MIFALLTFRVKRVRLLARSFLRSNILWHKQNFRWVQNSIFPNWLINSWNLRKWNISLIMLSSKRGQPCVNSQSYFQQWNLNQGITFPNSSTYSKLGLWNLGLRLYFQVFPNSQTDRKLGFLKITLAGLLNFSQFMEEIENWDFWILAYNVPKYLPLHYTVGKLGFLKFPCFHFLSDCEGCLSIGVHVMGKGADMHYESILWLFKSWKHCLEA